MDTSIKINEGKDDLQFNHLSLKKTSNTVIIVNPVTVSYFNYKRFMYFINLEANIFICAKCKCKNQIEQ